MTEELAIQMLATITALSEFWEHFDKRQLPPVVEEKFRRAELECEFLYAMMTGDGYVHKQ